MATGLDADSEGEEGRFQVWQRDEVAQRSAADLPAMLARPRGARPQAWVCRGSQCLSPVADIESLLKSLS